MKETQKQVRSVNLPELYPLQYRAFYTPVRNIYIEGATKSGKTVGGLTWIIDHTLRSKPGDAWWWIAPVSSTSDMARDRVVSWLPDGRDGYKVNQTKSFISFEGAGTIWFKSADKPDNLYGEDVHGAVFDEASRTTREAYNAVRSTLTATSGQLRAIGNVRDRSNWHYEKCRKAERGVEQNADYFKITAWDAVEAENVPVDEQDIEEAKQDYEHDPETFEALYLCKPPSDEGNPFSMEAINRMVTDGWADGPPVLWAWDLARSNDYTAGVALNGDGDPCEMKRFQRPWPETRRDIIRYTEPHPMIVDKTGVGDPMVEFLREEYTGRVTGFHFSTKRKQRLYDHLRDAVQDDKIRGIKRGSTLEHELRQFKYTRASSGLRYSAPPGEHDDCVDALALAWRLYRKMNFLKQRRSQSNELVTSSGGLQNPFED